MASRSEFRRQQHQANDAETPLLEDGGREQEPLVTFEVRDRAMRWSHVDNLDDFFTRIYEYHQRHGLSCMVLEELFELFQFVFIVAFTTFLFECVNYPILFRDRLPEGGGFQRNDTFRKVTLNDAVVQNCPAKIQDDSFMVMCLVVAAAVWLCRLLVALYQFVQYWEIRSFYTSALRIDSGDLHNLTWHEVQQRLGQVQSEQQLCINKRELQELDVYQRILRYENYIVAMVNKRLLPASFHLPFIGNVFFFTNSLKFNLKLMLFWRPFSPWAKYGQLKPEFKRRDADYRAQNVASLRQTMLLFALLNLVFAPLILLWQILYAFFSYADLIKREPSFLGARRWSLYGRYYFRHFNELDHELEQRLSRAYRPATHYMDMFVSNRMEIIAKNIAFFVGALLAVLLVLTAYDEDVLQVELCDWWN